jgi:hypothetical protein
MSSLRQKPGAFSKSPADQAASLAADLVDLELDRYGLDINRKTWPHRPSFQWDGLDEPSRRRLLLVFPEPTQDIWIAGIPYALF